MLENPWLTFNPKEDEPKVHRTDLPFFRGFNNGMESSKVTSKDSYLLAEHLEPFPYLGNPLANVFMLMANPGISKKEEKKSFKMNDEKIIYSRKNLRLEDLESMITRIESTENSELESVWLKPRVRELVEKTSVQRVTKGLFLVNFHAYHSKSWYPIPFTFPTQHYSFHLISEAIKREAVIIMGRNKLGWLTAIPGLFEYKKETRNVIEFDSARSLYISEGNLRPDSFKKILDRL